MNVIMPLAGRGSKFIAEGIHTPKPLIEIKGKTMIEWALLSVPFLLKEKIFFILRPDQIKQDRMDEKFRELFPKLNFDIIETNGLTEGAACTVLLAEGLINNEEELVIYNPDQYFKSDIEEIIKNKDKDAKGIIPTFYATHPRWSYVLKDEEDVVLKVREKEPISTDATVGFYYYSAGEDFVWGAKQMMKKNIRINNEYYVCPVYNQLIERGDKIIACPTKEMWGLGTPGEVEYFEKYYRDF